jgi:hypothetical protein
MINETPSGHQIQKLLFFVAQDVSDAAKAKIQEFVDALAPLRTWVVRPPYLVDVHGAAVRADCGIGDATLGGVLEIFSALSPESLPTEVDRLHLEEVIALVEALKRFSAKNDLEFELELDGKFVGAIEAGEEDRNLREGLIGEWRKRLGL